MKFQLIPRTERSIPWSAADRQLVPIFLNRYHYLEEEYFLSGQANVYTLSGNCAQLKHTDTPYTTRALIRRPNPSRKFSGNVVVELLNSSNSWDVSPMWSLTWPAILADGDVYVGLTFHPTCVAALKRYDQDRYAPLRLPSPEPGQVDPNVLMSHHCTPDTEFGLVWDILTQLGVAMKTDKAVERVYAMGCSQSAMFLSTYFNIFHENTRPSPITPPFDGYLAFTGSTMVPLTQQDAPPQVDDPIQVTRNCPVPIIRIMSQWDFCGFAGNLAHRREDSDEAGDRFRLYEIAGQAHNPAVGALYRPGFEEIQKIGQSTDFPHTDTAVLPTDAIVRQSLRNLNAWSRGWSVPPRAPGWIAVDKKGKPVFDGDGNVMGGLRLPQLEVPIARCSSGTHKNPQDSCMIPFSQKRLEELYPTHRDYVKKMFHAVDQLLFQNFISVQDADLLKMCAVFEPIPKCDHSL